MNILITGGCGFIGSNFINYIYDKEQNINIVNLDAMYYCANENNVREDIRSSDRYTFIEGNTGNADLINNILSSSDINYVINFAAQSHVCNSFSNPLQYTKDNILGTHVLLDCCYNYLLKYNKLKLFIHISTDEVYGESLDDDDKKIEQSILCPTNPYAATKAGAELIVQSYYHSFKMPIIITRGNNVYGPNQYPEKLVPKFIQLLKNNKKVTIQGDGSSIRAFLHSYDTTSAIYTILKKGRIGEIYNIGCDENMEISVIQFAKMLIKKVKNTDDYEKHINYVEDRPFNDKRYYISNNKLKELGWNITKTFDIEIDNLINM